MVRIQLHGRFAILVDGRPVEELLPGRRGRQLVAYLAYHRRPVEREDVRRLHLRALTCYAESCLALATTTELASPERASSSAPNPWTRTGTAC